MFDTRLQPYWLVTWHLYFPFPLAVTDEFVAPLKTLPYFFHWNEYPELLYADNIT